MSNYSVWSADLNSLYTDSPYPPMHEADCDTLAEARRIKDSLDQHDIATWIESPFFETKSETYVALTAAWMVAPGQTEYLGCKPSAMCQWASQAVRAGIVFA